MPVALEGLVGHQTVQRDRGPPPRVDAVALVGHRDQGIDGVQALRAYLVIAGQVPEARGGVAPTIIRRAVLDQLDELRDDFALYTEGRWSSSAAMVDRAQAALPLTIAGASNKFESVGIASTI